MTFRFKSAACSVLASLYPFAHTHAATVGETIVVTASRSAETVDDSLAAVSVLSREDIERSQALSLPELLRGLPGVSLSNSGGLGKVTSLFLRGTNADHTLVLIDGVRIGSATAGGAALQDLPPELIERIEVVRGPRSSLYGSEAIGGVVQIFTRRGADSGFKPWFSAGAGRYDSYELAGGVSGGSRDAWFNVGASGLSSGGFNACTGVQNLAGCFTDEPDDDGYRNASLSARGGVRLSQALELEAHALRSRGYAEFDGSFVNEVVSVQEVLGIKATAHLLPAWNATLSLGQARDNSDNYHDGHYTSTFDTKRFSASWQNDIRLGRESLLSAGIDYLNDQVDSNEAFVEDERDDAGVFAQLQTKLGNHGLQLAARRDDNQQFGNHNTYNLAWGYDLQPGLRLTASRGTAFKAPTFNDLYYPGFGNPELDPERSRSTELGLQGRGSVLRWALAAYQTDIDNLVAFDPVSFLPVSVNEARIRGLEASASITLAGWALAVNATVLDPENRADGANRGKVLPRRAQRSLRLDADRRFGAYGVGATLNAESHRYDDLANEVRLGGYATLDLRADYRFAPGWLAEARLSNAFDHDYETARYYQQAGAALFAGVRYSAP